MISHEDRFSSLIYEKLSRLTRSFALLAPLSAYFDESSDKNNRVRAIGGFIGRGDAWEKVLAAWTDRIRPERLPNKITAFHMTDCESGGGEFRDELGWTRESRKELIIDLLKIICRYNVVMFGVGMQTKDYLALEPVEADRLAHTDWHFLMQAVMCQISQKLEDEKSNREDIVSYFFDRLAKHETMANKIHKELRGDTRLSWTHRIGPLTFGDKAKMPLLQVGDVGAFESMKCVTNTLFSEGRTRRSFELLKGTQSVWRVASYDGETLQQIAEWKREEIRFTSKGRAQGA